MFLHAKNGIFCENHMQELTTYQIKEIGKENNNHIMQRLIILDFNGYLYVHTSIYFQDQQLRLSAIT